MIMRQREMEMEMSCSCRVSRTRSAVAEVPAARVEQVDRVE